MTNQQKIEFYLSKGFAVEVITKYNEKMTIYFKTCKYFTGIKGGSSVAVECDGDFVNNDIKSVTPIPPNPYEFSVGERVMLDGGEIKTIEKVLSGKDYNYSDKMIYADGWYRTTDNDEYPWYQLAPALPEDEEYEVVEVIDDGIFVRENGVFTFTKPDGKKLKIRVIKQ